ncbi:MAG: D-aminoacyl-tRNA deacylase [Fimbriimonas sp.]
MRAIVQRVSAATVRVDGREVGRCGYGLMLLVGIHVADTEKEAKKLAEKVSTLRIFNDEDGKMNLALVDFPAKGAPTPMYEFGVLAISNFTVYGDAKKSRRPSFTESAGFEQGRALFELFVQELRTLNIETQTGMFGAHMEVALINDGPVTIVLDV